MSIVITLYGWAISNYCNKIKLALLEKEISFTEVEVFTRQIGAVSAENAAWLTHSPIGKIPFIATKQGYLSESHAILEYLEDSYPQNPLYPADSFQRAKCRELMSHLELNVEVHAHSLVKEAFFGGTVSEEVKNTVRELLDVGFRGVTQLAQFSPYIAGDTYTLADIMAWLHFGMISTITQIIYAEDLVSTYIPHIAEYMALIESRPAAQIVAADRAVAMAAFLNSKINC
jgi:glutathione S-transferase